MAFMSRLQALKARSKGSTTASNKQDFLAVAIDGPTAGGKITSGRLLSRKLGIPCLYTGFLYRAVTIYCLDNTVNPQEVVQHLAKIKLEVRYRADGTTDVIIGNVTVTARLEDEDVNKYVSVFANTPCVREYVAGFVRAMAQRGSIICVGRDVASIILTNAKYKFYVTASSQVRLERRIRQEHENGHRITPEEAAADIARRDVVYTARGLVCTPDSIVIDNTKISTEQVVDLMLKYIRG
jgi:cytidylate kinase